MTTILSTRKAAYAICKKDVLGREDQQIKTAGDTYGVNITVVCKGIKMYFKT
jgi:hypothetical protein